MFTQKTLNERLTEALQANDELKADAWDAAINEVHERGWLSKDVRQDMLARNPYRKEQ